MMTDNTKQLDGPGFGTFNAIEALEELVNQNELQLDTLMINVSTLARNRYDRKTDAITLTHQCESDMDIITNQLGGIEWPSNRLTVVFYYVSYYKVLKDRARAIPASKAEYDSTCNHLGRRMRNPKNRSIGSVDAYWLTFPPAVTYYRNMNRINEISKMTHVVMLTHAYSDLHYGLINPKLKLLESFTGDIVDISELSEKVFDTSAVPFYPETHLMLGDKHYVLPMYQRKDKKEIIRVAEEEKWKYHNRSKIRSSAIKHGWLKLNKRYPLV